MPIRISKNRVALENVPLNLAQELDVASAATTNIGAALSNNVRITGTTTITAFDNVNAGIIRFIRFAGALTLTHNSTTLKLPGSQNITTSADDRAIARSFGSGNWEVFDYVKASGEAVVGSGNAYNLTNIIAPRADGDWRGIYRGGWRPAFFNQQWGGAQWGNGPDGSLTDFATGAVENDSAVYFANAAGSTWRAQGFKVSENITVSGVWVRLYKIGNPANNAELYILPDDGSGTKPTGSTPVTNGASVAQSGKLHTANTDGEWVKFVFATPPSLTAGTQYHIAMKSSGAVDASNYWAWKSKSSNLRYPFGYMSAGDGTPTWSAAPTYQLTFLVEPSAANRFLQPSGQFSGKLVFAEGSPLDQSKGLSQPLKNFFDGYEFTYRGVFSSLTKDKTVADFLYGLDHDRIVLRCNITTGYLQLDVYESDGTKHTVTSTTDCSTGTKDIAIYIRAKGDGSDAVKLYVNGASEGTPVTSATITFSTEFRDLGTAWIGGGFPLAPTWTKDTAMGSLPSADGWTYTGTATEGNAFSVSDGILYQNGNALSSATGYYQRTTTLSNTNGWTVVWQNRVLTSATNSSDTNSCVLNVADGTRPLQIYMQNYYLLAGSTAYVYPQLDMTKKNTFVLIGKGTDFFLFCNGKLLVDGTGKMDGSTASNNITFGDATATAGGTNDAQWYYVKDYNTAWLPPQFTSGSCSEAAYFSGDRTSILSSLYNGGTFKSVREYCGVEGEYIERIEDVNSLQGITSGPTTTSTTFVVLTDMEGFFIGERAELDTNLTVDSTAIIIIHLNHYLDGAPIPRSLGVYQYLPANQEQQIGFASEKTVFAGLHKQETNWMVGSGTGRAIATRRTMNMRNK